MRRYQIFNSKDEIIHEDYFNDIDEVKEWAKNNEEADYCLEVYLLYDKLVNVLASKGKTIEDIRHVNIHRWWTDDWCYINTEEYLNSIKKSYISDSCENVNIILDDSVVIVRKEYDDELRKWKSSIEYIELSRGKKNW